MVSNEILLDVVKRLENCISEVKGLGSGNNQQAKLAQEKDKPLIRPFTEYWNLAKENMNKMLDSASKINLGEEFLSLTHIAIEGICLQQDIFDNQEHYKLPSEQEFGKVQEKLISLIKRATEIANKKRELDVYCQAIINGLNSLYWSSLGKDGLEVVQQYSDMIDNYRNKIIVKKIQEESDWVNSWKNTFIALVKLVKMEYKAGLPFNYKSSKTFEEFLGKIGDNYTYFTQNKKFRVLTECSQSSKCKETKENTDSKEANKVVTPNSEFISLMQSAFNKMISCSKAEEVKIENLDFLTTELGKAYGILAYVLDASKKYKFPSEDDMKKVSTLLLEKVKVIKDIPSANMTELNLFKDNVENSLNSLHWFTRNEQCADIAQYYIEMIDISGNKILMKKIPSLSEWVKSNKEILTKMLQLIKLNYKNGLSWDYQQGSSDFDEFYKNLVFNQRQLVNSKEEKTCSDCICYILSKEGLTKQTSCICKDCKESCVCLENASGIISFGGAVKTISLKNSNNITLRLSTCDSVLLAVTNSKEIKIECCGKVYTI